MIYSPGVQIPNGAVTYLKAGTGVMRRIATATVSGAAATSISFTGLSLNGKQLVVIGETVSAGAGEGTLYCYFNNDTTNTNYNSQRLYGSGAAAGAAAANVPRFCYINTVNGTVFHSVISKTASKVPRVITHDALGDVPAAVNIFGMSWIGTADITRIDFTADAAAGLGIGTKITLFEVT